MKIEQRLCTEVLVIGGGGAGLRAALAAAEAGSRVLVVNKGPVARSGITLVAAGGIQAPFHPEDDPDSFFRDTVECGYGLGDRSLARVLAAEACERVLDLERYGARIIRDADGRFALGRFPGQSQPRILFVKGGGVGMAVALAAACRRQELITVQDDFFVTGLVRAAGTRDNTVAGALGLDLRTGALTLISAKAVVLATGGCQWLWAVNDCPADATGEGVVQAYRAGAELVDMEMVLFYPSVVVWPPSLQGALIHYEYLDGAVFDGNVYDRDGAAVLPKPLPVRDRAMRIMAEAIAAGRGGPHGGLFWYVGDSPKGVAAVREALNTAQYNYFRSHGVEPAIDRVEAAPGAHYLMGGVAIDAACRTSVRGLFATPECAGNFDGANRLAGSGLTATQVFGARAGRYAHEWAAANEVATADAAVLEEEAGRVASRVAGSGYDRSRVAALTGELRAAVQRHAGVSREASGLARLAAVARAVRDEAAGERVPATAAFNQQLVELLQLESMCTAAELVAGCALLRQESRGHHFRADFPAPDDAGWLRHTTVRAGAGGPVFGTRPVNMG